MASEKSPLLSNQGDANTQQYGEPSDESQTEQQTYVTVPPIGPDVLPPPYSPSPHGVPMISCTVCGFMIDISESQTEQQTYVTVPPIGPDELPPPYSPSPHGVPMISCKVCGFMIDISGRRDQHVVKCSSCNEATPIKSAPPGKKYVRCPCQCLLICKSSSQRISCPRNNCKRILNLASLPAAPLPSSVPGMCQVCCAHCRSVFLFNTLTNALARCPHCRKVSSVGPQYARSRGIMYLIAAFLLLAVAIGVTFGTLSQSRKHKFLYFIHACLYTMFVILLYKAIYHFAMKVSEIDGPV